MKDIDVVITLARSYLWVREVPPDSNKGQAVEHFLSRTGLGGGYPWCAAFIATIGRDALGSRWPLPVTAGCQALYEGAGAKQLVRDEPAVGDVFVLWHESLQRFAHTGLIVGRGVTNDGHFVTIEGNTAGDGRREGWGVFQRTRLFGPQDRFLRWVDAPV